MSPTGEKKKVYKMSAAELALESGLCVSTIQRYAKRGLIPGKNHRGRRGWVFNRAAALRAISLKFGNGADKALHPKP